MLRVPRSLSLLVALYSLLLAPLAFGQGALDRTDYGKSQNTAADLANSLTVPNRVHTGKEKKEELDPRKLPSKTVKDTTFQGSLLNVGLPDKDTKLQEQKKPAGDDRKVSKSTAVDSEKPSTVSKQADGVSGKETGSKSPDASGDGQNKEHKVTSAAADEKASVSFSTEKPAAPKPDGEH